MTFFNHLKPETPDDRALSREQASRLLSIGVVGPRRPVDDLIDCLRREAGPDWLDRSVDATLRQTIGRAAADLIDGRLTLEELRTAKDAAKNAMRAAVGREEAAGATALYFIAIAAALAHFGEPITTRPREDLDPVLVDLAEASPPRWRSLVERALER